MIAEKSPRAGATANAGTHGDGDILRERFPFCELRGVRIVDRLPDGCPLATPWPLHAVAQLQDRGWGRLGDTIREDAGGLGDLERMETCERCIGWLLRHRHVEYLRRRLGVSL